MKNFLGLLLLPSLVFANELVDNNKSDVMNNTDKQVAVQDQNSDTKASEDLSKAGDVVKSEENTKQEENMNQTQETKDAASAFLAENSKKDGVVSLNNDLQYKVIEEGDGPQPSINSSVTVHYEGTFVDGKEFDSSFKRNEPATFNLDQVILGWTEALPHMKTGATWVLYIGPKLAYGEKGIPGVIPPNSVLVFKIKLIKVNS